MRRRAVIASVTQAVTLLFASCCGDPSSSGAPLSDAPAPLVTASARPATEDGIPLRVCGLHALLANAEPQPPCLRTVQSTIGLEVTTVECEDLQAALYTVLARPSFRVTDRDIKTMWTTLEEFQSALNQRIFPCNENPDWIIVFNNIRSESSDSTFSIDWIDQSSSVNARWRSGGLIVSEMVLSFDGECLEVTRWPTCHADIVGRIHRP